MPELPEVETTLNGIRPEFETRLLRIEVREPRLRWPVTEGLEHKAQGKPIALLRRGKYIIVCFSEGDLIIHLGMSGSMRICHADQDLRKHDHIIFHFASGRHVRFHDPRRFGCLLWCEDWTQHKLIRHLGPEPLSEAFTGEYLYQKSRNKRVPVKQFVMDSRIVVGVGNIYANEALFRAGISPIRQAGHISLKRYETLCDAIKAILSNAIEVGGTTLRDFVSGNNQPGYFQQTLSVYGRANQDCVVCGQNLSEIKLSSRSTVYCKHCQR